MTDAYLLALAAKHGGRFVTFDRSVALSGACGDLGQPDCPRLTGLLPAVQACGSAWVERRAAEQEPLGVRP